MNSAADPPPGKSPAWTTAADSLASVLRRITLRRLALAVIALPVLLYVYREATRDALIINPITVPRQFEDAGLTSEVMANRIGNSLRELELSAHSRQKQDSPISSQDLGSPPDIEIPGTGLGLKTGIQVVRAIFRIYPQQIDGDIAFPRPAAKEDDPENAQVIVTLYITTRGRRSQAVHLTLPADDIKALAKQTAIAILGQINPYMLGAYDEQTGNYDDAERIANQIIHSRSGKPGDVTAAYNLMGNVLSDRGDDEGAIAQYKEAIRRDRRFVRAFINLANALNEQHDVAGAVDKYREAIKLDRSEPMGYDGLGFVFAGQANYEAAIGLYKKALDTDSADSVAYAYWGNALAIQGKYEEAILQYRAALALNPNESIAQNGLDDALANQQRFDLAVARYEKEAGLDPNKSAAYANWGAALAGQGKYDDAIEKYQRAVSIDPKNAAAYAEWSEALAKQNKCGAAAAMVQKAATLDPALAEQWAANARCVEAATQLDIDKLIAK